MTEIEKILEVSEKGLINIFTSQKFLSRLETTANFTLKNGMESGFIIVKELNNRFFYGCPVYGLRDTLDKENYFRISEELLNIDSAISSLWTRSLKKKLLQDPGYSSPTVLNFHFHPEEMVPTPSSEDLSMFFYDRKFNYIIGGYHSYPISGIGIIELNKHIKILLYQSSSQKMESSKFGELISETLDEKHGDNCTNDHILNHLREFGLKAELIEYSKKNGRYKIEDADIKKLSKFAHKIRVTYDNRELKSILTLFKKDIL